MHKRKPKDKAKKGKKPDIGRPSVGVGRNPPKPKRGGPKDGDYKPQKTKIRKPKIRKPKKR